MSSSSLTSTKVLVLLDRFVSASSAHDAQTSLEDLLTASRQHDNQNDLYEWIWQDDHIEFQTALLHVLTTRQHKNEMPLDDGPRVILQWFLLLLGSNSRERRRLLTLPSSGQVLEAVLDVACATTTTTTSAEDYTDSYTRVLALQVLEQLCQIPKAQDAMLKAPNGLHRLADLLLEEEEQIRNQALLLCCQMANWASVAKVWMFDEMADKLVQLALQQQQDFVIVKDALQTLWRLLQHDASSSRLMVSSSPQTLYGLAQFLDLRKATRFQNPQDNNNNNDDDLDAILQSQDSAKKPTRTVPSLTEAEEERFQLVLNILSTLLESPDVQTTIWEEHVGLCCLVWECALMAPPPPEAPYACGVPSAALQQAALECVALHLNSSKFLKILPGCLDRLLYLVCTGGALAASGISQAALHVLRTTLPAEQAHELWLHTLAPPPLLQEGAPPEATPIQKLLNTVYETADATTQPTLLVSGSLGALAVFLQDAASREMLLKLTQDDLVNLLLQQLTKPKAAAGHVRFLCEWMWETPAVVHQVWKSPHTTNVLNDFLKNAKTSSLTLTLVQVLLGLSMEFMEDEAQCGGWTRASLLQLLSQTNDAGGIGAVTTALEDFKKVKDLEEPWNACKLEWKVWQSWYANCVQVVRKRIVSELIATKQQASEDPTTQVLQQQAQELERLNSLLKERDAQLAKQDKELLEWKRRLESTPTQLDAMLTEYSSKTQQLENTVSELQTQLKDMQETELTQRDTRIQQLETDLQQQKNLQEETVNERNALQEELQALGQAYSILEGEYQRLQQSATTNATAVTTEHQNEGEESQQAPPNSGSTEMATLRAENSRLRSDAIAADEWMQMAVQRMNEMGAQNQTLQQQLTAALESKESPAETQQAVDYQAQIKSLHEAVESITSEREELQLKVDSLENELDRSRAVVKSLEENDLSPAVVEEAMSKLKAEHDNVVARKDQEMAAIKTQLEQLQQQGGTLVESAELVKLRQSIEKLQQDLLAARNEVETNRQREQKEIYKREATIRELEGRLGRGQGAYSLEDIQARDEEIEQLRAANESAQDWMSKAVEHHQIISNQLAELGEEKGNLSLQVKELRAQLATTESISAGANRLREELATKTLELESARKEVARREDELQQLREEKSSGQIEALRVAQDEIANLRRAVSEWEAKSKSTDTSDREIKELREELRKEAELKQVAHEEIRSLKIVIGSRSAELQELEVEFEKLRASESNAKQEQEKLGQQLMDLKEQLSQEEVTRTDSHDLAQGLEDEVRRLNALNRELEADMDPLKVELEVLRQRDLMSEQAGRAAQDEIRTLGAQLSEREQESRKLRDSLGALEKEAERLRSELGTLGALSSELADKTAQIEYLEGEVQNNKEEKERLERDCQAFSRMIEQLKEEVAVLQDAKDSSSADIQKTLSDAMKRIAELETREQDMESQLQEAVSSRERAEEALEVSIARLEESTAQISSLSVDKEGLRETNVTLTSQVEALEGQNTNLTKQIRSLEEELEAVSEQVIDLEEKTLENQFLEAKLREKENELRGAEAHLVQDEDVVREWEVRVEELEASNKNLEMQLEQQEKEAEDVISQWQNTCNELEARTGQLEEDLEIAKAASVDTGSHKEELETSIANLKAQLEQQENEAQDLISQWKKRCNELEARITNLEEELEASKASSVDTANKEELEANIKNLEAQLEEQEKEAQDVISQWQKRCNEVESRTHQLQEELEVAKAASMDTTSMDELQANIKNLEMQLEQQERDAQDVISNLQNTCNDLKEKNKHVEQEVAASNLASTEELARLRGLLSEKDTELEELSQQLQSERSAFDAEKKSLLSSSDEQKESLVKAAAEAKRLKTELEETRAELEVYSEKVSELESEIAELNLEICDREKQLENYQEEVDETIQARCATAETRISELEKTLESSGNERDMLIASLKAAEEASEEYAKLVASVKEDLNRKEGVVRSLTEQIDRKSSSQQQDYNHIISQLDAERASHAETRQEIASLRQERDEMRIESEEIVNQWKERAAQLESSVTMLENQLEQQESDANEAIACWESRCAEMEEQLLGMEADAEQGPKLLIKHLEHAIKVKEFFISSLDSERIPDRKMPDIDVLDALLENNFSASVIGPLQEDDKALTESLMSSLKQLRSDVTAKVEECDSLRAALSEETSRIEELQSQLISEDEDLKESRDELTGLREQVGILKNQKKELSDSEERLRAEYGSLEKTIIAERAKTESLAITMNRLEESLNVEKKKSAELRDRYDELSKALQTEKAKMDSMAIQRSELEKDISEKRNNLTSLEDEAKTLRSRCDELARLEKEARGDLASATTALEAERAKNESVLNDITKETDDKRKALEQQINEMEEQIAELGASLDASRKECEKLKNSLEESKTTEGKTQRDVEKEIDSLKEEAAALRLERETLVATIGRLEAELEETHDDMRVYVTETLSEKATEIAAGALREQIDDLLSQLEEDKHSLSQERDKRLAAEQEISRLEADIQALIVLADDNTLKGQSHTLSERLAERVQNKEREELKALKESLSRAQFELTKSREAEKGSQEQAAKARLQASVCEQEVITAKSDLAFLTSTLEEVRDAEAAERARMKDRILSLQEEQEVQKRFHSAEVEDLRNEITQLSMEKDQISLALKETRQKCNALVEATSKQRVGAGDSSIPGELDRLRVEKAHLLNAAAADGAKTERRLREAIAAQNSSAEADVIVEREVRIAAETALENMRLELEELRKEGQKSLEADSKTQPKPTDNYAEELNKWKRKTQKLAEENASLRQKADEAELQIEELTEECRKAQSSALKLHHEGRFEAEVKYEVSRLQAGAGDRDNPAGDWLVVDENREGGKMQRDLAAAGAYDVIEKMKSNYLEMHGDLVAEHEELLAVFATLSLEHDALKAALEQEAGVEAVELALASVQEA